MLMRVGPVAAMAWREGGREGEIDVLVCVTYVLNFKRTNNAIQIYNNQIKPHVLPPSLPPIISSSLPTCAKATSSSCGVAAERPRAPRPVASKS